MPFTVQLRHGSDIPVTHDSYRNTAKYPPASTFNVLTLPLFYLIRDAVFRLLLFLDYTINITSYLTFIVQ